MAIRPATVASVVINLQLRCLVLAVISADVTRSVIPFLARRGITGLTIGSNGADKPPQVPKLHRWVDKATSTDVIVAYHPWGCEYVGVLLLLYASPLAQPPPS